MNWRSVFSCLALALCISQTQATEGRAFVLVSPSVQHAFRTPQRFLDVVRMAYRAVYRPVSIVFLDLRVMSGEVVQQVQLTDRGGAL